MEEIVTGPNVSGNETDQSMSELLSAMRAV